MFAKVKDFEFAWMSHIMKRPEGSTKSFESEIKDVVKKYANTCFVFTESAKDSLVSPFRGPYRIRVFSAMTLLQHINGILF